MSFVEFAGIVRQRSIVVELNDHCKMSVGCETEPETVDLPCRSSVLRGILTGVGEPTLPVSRCARV